MSIYPIPKDALDDRFAVVGTAGSGKTYLALGAVEHLLARKSRVILVDPLGVAWGLRLCADGKTPSPFQPVIFGGPHGDLPITEHAGAIIGEAVATSRDSCIVDLSALGTKAAERRFMLAFLTALYRCTDKEPVHLIIDEADMFAPQRLMDKDGDAAKLLGMMETIVRRGRSKGFVPWLLTQRPAVLSKDVLSQADGLVALKLTSSQDRDAIGAWIEGQGDKAQGKAMLASLPAKQRGSGVLWIPGRGILADVDFPAKATFDSSRTPKRGEKRQDTTLKPIDLGALKNKLAKVETDAKANDPRALQAEVRRLTGELAKASRQTSHPVEKINTADAARTVRTQEAAISAARAQGAEEGWREGWPRGWAAGQAQAVQSVTKSVEEHMLEVRRADPCEPPGSPKPPKRQAVVALTALASNAPAALTDPPRRAPAALAGAGAGITRLTGGQDDGLTTPQRRIMSAIGFWLSVGTEAPNRAQVAGVAGYSPGSGGFNNLLGALKTAGLIKIPATGCVALADGSPFDALSREDAAARLWSVLTGPETKLVTVALSHDKMTRDGLAEATDYSAGSGGFNNLIGHLCTLTVFEKPSAGCVKISDWAAEVLA